MLISEGGMGSMHKRLVLVLQTTKNVKKKLKLFTFLVQHKCPTANYHEILPGN